MHPSDGRRLYTTPSGIRTIGKTHPTLINVSAHEIIYIDFDREISEIRRGTKIKIKLIQ